MMNSGSLRTRLLAARFLTRSGDQAWDFAVPLALLQIFPNELRIAAFYYLLVRIAQVAFLPRLAATIDRVSRLTAIRTGIGLQTIGVLLGAFSLILLWDADKVLNYVSVTLFSILVIGGLLSSLGSAFTEIAVANDLVPASIPSGELTSFNSRLRQVDLFTEVTSPILAGVLLVLSIPYFPHAGFLWVALWNALSFIPEYLLLASVLRQRPDLNNKMLIVPIPMKQSLSDKLFRGWKVFFKDPIWPVIACYALLWLSVLSPHGVLLTAYLKDGWQLPEWQIGLFRGGGALFGLAATLLFPIAVKRVGLVNSSRAFILFQAACLILGLFCFYGSGNPAQIGFLVAVLFSRIGLYGFSLGEMQVRQIAIAPERRGEMNGFANALTGLATLALFGAGALLPSTNDFHWLVLGSTAIVGIAAVWFSLRSYRLKASY